MFKFSFLLVFVFLSSHGMASPSRPLSREDKVLALIQDNSIPFIEAGKLKDIYSDRVVFQDPIQTVNGYDSVATYLIETFKLLQFQTKATRIVRQGSTYIAFWTAEAQLLAGPLPIGQPFIYEGLSVLTFDRSNKIIAHRDYFDQFALYRIIPGFEQKASQMLGAYIQSQLPPQP